MEKFNRYEWLKKTKKEIEDKINELESEIENVKAYEILKKNKLKEQVSELNGVKTEKEVSIDNSHRWFGDKISFADRVLGIIHKEIEGRKDSIKNLKDKENLIESINNYWRDPKNVREYINNFDDQYNLNNEPEIQEKLKEFEKREAEYKRLVAEVEGMEVLQSQESLAEQENPEADFEDVEYEEEIAESEEEQVKPEVEVDNIESEQYVEEPTTGNSTPSGKKTSREVHFEGGILFDKMKSLFNREKNNGSQKSETESESYYDNPEDETLNENDSPVVEAGEDGLAGQEVEDKLEETETVPKGEPIDLDKLFEGLNEEGKTETVVGVESQETRMTEYEPQETRVTTIEEPETGMAEFGDLQTGIVNAENNNEVNKETSLEGVSEEEIETIILDTEKQPGLPKGEKEPFTFYDVPFEDNSQDKNKEEAAKPRVLTDDEKNKIRQMMFEVKCTILEANEVWVDSYSKSSIESNIARAKRILETNKSKTTNKKELKYLEEDVQRLEDLKAELTEKFFTDQRTNSENATTSETSMVETSKAEKPQTTAIGTAVAETLSEEKVEPVVMGGIPKEGTLEIENPYATTTETSTPETSETENPYATATEETSETENPYATTTETSTPETLETENPYATATEETAEGSSERDGYSRRGSESMLEDEPWVAKPKKMGLLKRIWRFLTAPIRSIKDLIMNKIALKEMASANLRGEEDLEREIRNAERESVAQETANSSRGEARNFGRTSEREAEETVRPEVGADSPVMENPREERVKKHKKRKFKLEQVEVDENGVVHLEDSKLLNKLVKKNGKTTKRYDVLKQVIAKYPNTLTHLPKEVLVQLDNANVNGINALDDLQGTYLMATIKQIGAGKVNANALIDGMEQFRNGVRENADEHQQSQQINYEDEAS